MSVAGYICYQLQFTRAFSCDNIINYITWVLCSEEIKINLNNIN
jgi:hypothetical protein